MPRFSESLCESIRDYGRMSPTEGRRQPMQAAPVYQQMGTKDPLARSLGRLFGNVGFDTSSLQTAPERIAAETKGLDMTKPMDAARAMLIRAQYIQDPQAQAAMVMKAQELMQAEQQKALAAAKEARDAALQQQVRESLQKRASALGLEGVAETLAAGGPLEDAQQVIRDEEIKRAAARSNKSYRELIGAQYGIPEEDVAAFESASDETFNQLLEGYEGTPKAYQNAAGQVQMLRTLSKSGKVRDPETGIYKNPSELQLQPAPSVQRVINQADKSLESLTEGVAGLAVDSIGESTLAANEAVLTLQNVDSRLSLLDSEAGVYSGTFANFRTDFDKWAYAMSGGNIDLATATNTELLTIQGLREVGRFIQQFGSGTGLSDKDAELSANAVAANPRLTEETIRQTLLLAQRIARDLISNHEQIIDKAVEAGVPAKLLDLLSVTQNRYTAQSQAEQDLQKILSEL